ncbi:sodium:solute symporter family protein [[Clostridium] symbiosum]|uniref:sodium:solute symporter family protein n=1 Tax=Clostridium symbiosum TaxID=1512 RepID=UPI001D083A38|nr:sodium:solute symporter family protein [[Clostridium] symbiosum]MCB6608014.1 sodium:solute symporter family protein [[Clostridium] symbiosum]MCB6931343.1 sodium:solute symporter family protein [[Clostridium] symbiosum]
MNAMIPTIVIVLIIYFAAMVVIGWMGRSKASNFEGYLSMGRSAGVLLLMGGAIGGQIGNGFVVGGAAEGAASGLAGAAYGIACALSTVLVAVFLNNFIYNNGYMSMADYTRKRYHNEIPGTIYDLSTAISSIGLIAGQIMAGKALFEALGLPGNVGAIAIAVVVLMYSQLSGLWGAFATSVIQTGVILVGLVSTTFVLFSRGAVGEMSAAVQAGTLAGSSLNFSGLSAAGFAGMMLPLLLGMVTDQPTYQRINSAKSAKISRIACYLSCMVMIPLALMPAFIGSYGAFKYGATGNSAFFDVILMELPAIVCALIIAAVLAAVMSTIDCGLITMSTVLTRDIWQGALKKNPSEAQLKKITLVVNIGFMFTSTALALSASSILGLLNSVYSFLAAACFVPFVGGVAWKRGTATGAVAASIVGVATVLISWIPGMVFPLGNIIPSGIFPIIPSAVAYIIVSLCTKHAEVKTV